MPVVASGQLTLTDLNDAKQLAMYIGASQSRSIIFNGVSTYTPNYASTNQVLTPQLFIAGDNTDVASQAISVKWYYQANGSGTPVEITTANAGSSYTIGTTMPYSLTIKQNLWTSNTSITYICEVVYPDASTGFNVTSKAELEIVKITNGTNGSNGSNGSNAIIGVLSNESANVPATSAGSVTSYTGANTQLTIYNGATDDTANWTISQALSGCTVTASGTPANRIATVTAMSADVATVTFTATRSGYSSIVKVFTINKTKAGSDGNSPTAYNMIVSTAVLGLNQAKTAWNPTSITVTAKAQTGTNAPANYNGRFIIDESTDGTTFGTAKYTSASDQSTYTYTPSAPSSNIKAVRVRMFTSGGTSNQVDEQVIRVVQDGTDAIYANVWTPDGNSIKNSSGNVKAQCDLYNGSVVVTGTAYKWYAQDPTATVASGGDADGGAGWRLINATWNAGVTGYTTATIVIPPSAVAGMESFKCVATYNGIKYSNVTTVIDISDPILVRLDGVDKFKNGQGTITIRATLLQAGAEIDPLGNSGYTYAWSIYNSSNVKTAFSKTGKEITVLASDISGRGNLVCDVSK
jgi:hypothetical protein